MAASLPPRSATGSCTPISARAWARSAWICGCRLGVADEKLLRVLRRMEGNIEAPQSRAELARIAGVSVRQLERLFRRHLGHGIHRQYSSMRLERARQLLRETTLPVLDVAIATGFSSSSQFARAYKRTFGEPPSRTRLSG